MYRIPKAILVGFGRSQAIQYICAKCGCKFFPGKNTYSVYCSTCKDGGSFEESSVFYIDVVGWEQRLAVRGKRSTYNFTKVMRRDLYTCRYCGYSPTYAKQFQPLHIDHIIPHCTGGDNSMANLVVACEWCNIHLTDRIFPSFLDRKIFIVELRQQKKLPYTKKMWEDNGL